MSTRLRTLCLNCGPNIAVTEDECCATCGATATGPWLDKVAVVASEEPVTVAASSSPAARRRLYELTVHGASSEQPARDPSVRDLAEEIASSQYNRNSKQAKAWKTVSDRWERHLSAFLDEQMARRHGAEIGRLVGNLAGLRWAMERIERYVSECQHEKVARVVLRETRDALVHGGGHLETEVLRAAVLMADATEFWLEFDNEAQVRVCIPCGIHGERLEDIVHEDDCPIKVFVAYRDAMLAARGGEG